MLAANTLQAFSQRCIQAAVFSRADRQTQAQSDYTLQSTYNTLHRVYLQ